MTNKILVVGYSPPPLNGMSFATIPLLGSERFSIDFVDLSDESDRTSNGSLTVRNIIGAVTAARRMCKALRHRPDISHIPIAQNRAGFYRDCMLIALALLGKSRVVVHLHGGYFHRFFAKLSALERRAIRLLFLRVSRGIVLADTLRGCLADILPTDRIHVVGNGSDDMTCPNSEVSAAPDSIRVGYIGTLTEEKGTGLLLELARRKPDIEVALAGPATDAIRKSAHEIPNVVAHGPLVGVEKRQFLNSLTVFAMPTSYKYEGQPISILEAMSAGLPVIATDHAAISETLGETFLSCHGGSVDELTEQVSALLADKQRANELGFRNRIRWEQNFSAAAYLERVEDIWEGILVRDA